MPIMVDLFSALVRISDLPAISVSIISVFSGSPVIFNLDFTGFWIHSLQMIFPGSDNYVYLHHIKVKIITYAIHSAETDQHLSGVSGKWYVFYLPIRWFGRVECTISSRGCCQLITPFIEQYVPWWTAIRRDQDLKGILVYPGILFVAMIPSKVSCNCPAQVESNEAER